MKRRFPFIVRAGAAGTVIAAACSLLVPPPVTGVAVSRELGRGLPLFFVPNRGQAAAAVQYTLRTPQFRVQFQPAETYLDLGRGGLAIRFAGANLETRIEALEGLAGKVNFLLGGKREDWQTGVPTYGAILYHDLYPGIDLSYSVAQGRLKSEFRVSPGADPGAIRWQYQGGAAPRMAGDGGLVVAAGGGELREHSPVMYQEKDGRRLPVQGAFRILDGGWAGFAIGAFDRQRPLVIDPVLSYSTYLGGGGLDSVRAIAVDSAGNAYVAGQTDSTDFPVAGAVRPTSGGGVDAFIAKLNVAGNALVYSTYLGGSWDDRAYGIAVDGSGNAYVTGWTYSPNFPTTSGGRQRMLGGGRDAFVAKLNAAGDTLLYSTYLGGQPTTVGTPSRSTAQARPSSPEKPFPSISPWPTACAVPTPAVRTVLSRSSAPMAAPCSGRPTWAAMATTVPPPWPSTRWMRCMSLVQRTPSIFPRTTPFKEPIEEGKTASWPN